MQTNRLMLIIAIVAGVISMAAAFGYLRSVSGQSTRDKAEPGVDVLVAAADLPADHTLDPAADLKTQKIPSRTYAGLVRSSIKADERTALRGRRLSNPIAAGTPVRYADLAGVADISIAPGNRAMAIKVDAEGTLGGMLVPGDRVDVVVAWPLPKAETARGNSQQVTSEAALAAALSEEGGELPTPPDYGARTLLPNVRIVAIGQALNRSRQQFLFEEPRSSGGAAVVTIEVTTDEALELIRATASGRNKLTLLLRPSEGAAALPAAGSTLQ